MSYFYYKGILYYNIRQFCLDYDLAYDSVRYHMRKFGSKEKFLDYLHNNSPVIDVLIKRYSKKRGAK